MPSTWAISVFCCFSQSTAAFRPELAQVLVEDGRGDAPVLFEFVQPGFELGLLFGLVRGAAQDAHELLADGVEHIVGVVVPHGCRAR